MRLAARHWGFLLLLAVGACVRVLAVYAFSPAFTFPDSLSYLQVAATGEAQAVRPWGYSGYLALVSEVVPFGGVAATQHLLGLVTVVIVYALLQRRGVRRLISCLAVAPLALDGYLIQIEHYLMAESLYVFLLMAGLVLLLWRERAPWWMTGASGVLLGLSAVTRTVGMVVLAVVALYALVQLIRRRFGVLAVASAAVGVAAVLVPYVVWFHSYTGSYAVTDYTGHFLYGRVSNFADCSEVDVPEPLVGLCPTQPVAERPIADWYVWDPTSPANSGRYTEDDLSEFAQVMIRGQFGDFFAGSAQNALHYFMPGRYSTQFDYCTHFWDFPVDEPPAEKFCQARLATQGYELEPASTQLRPGPAKVLATYQDIVHVPGPALGLLVLVGLSGLVRHRRRGEWRDAFDGAFCVVLGLAVVAVPAATAIFDYRYGLPVLALFPVGAALATRGWFSTPVPEEMPADAVVDRRATVPAD